MGERIAIARLLTPFGIKGYVKVQLYAQDADRLNALREVLIGATPEGAAPVGIEDALVQNNGVMVKLAGVPDRTAAERIVGQYLFVDEADIVRLPKGSYFIHDIVGCTVELADGTAIGTVSAVQQFPAQDIWMVAYRGRQVMIPAVKEFVKRVEIDRRVVVVQNVEGFLEA